MLKAFLALIGIGTALGVGIKMIQTPKSFILQLSPIDWVNKKFDYELLVDGKVESSEKNISFTSGSSGSAGKKLETKIIREPADGKNNTIVGTIRIEVFYDKKQVAGKIVDFSKQITLTFSPGI